MVGILVGETGGKTVGSVVGDGDGASVGLTDGLSGEVDATWNEQQVAEHCARTASSQQPVRSAPASLSDAQLLTESRPQTAWLQMLSCTGSKTVAFNSSWVGLMKVWSRLSVMLVLTIAATIDGRVAPTAIPRMVVRLAAATDAGL